jgi:hypothetical protein
MNQNKRRILGFTKNTQIKGFARTNRDLDGKYKETRTMPKFSVYANQPEWKMAATVGMDAI